MYCRCRVKFKFTLLVVAGNNDSTQLDTGLLWAAVKNDK